MLARSATTPAAQYAPETPIYGRFTCWSLPTRLPAPVASHIATTQWSQVLAARDGSDTEAKRALEQLCQTYWQPLYAYVRRQGADPESARDLTQAYFVELLDRDLLSQVDPSKGRFRSYLLATLRNFLGHQRERRQALKRGGATITLSLDFDCAEQSYATTATDMRGPDELFEYRWAITVLSRAVARMQRDAEQAGSGAQFRQLKRYLVTGEAQIPYRDSAAALGISESAVKSAVQRLRKRLGRYLREEIRQTVADPADVDDEVRHLLNKVRP